MNVMFDATACLCQNVFTFEDMNDVRFNFCVALHAPGVRKNSYKMPGVHIEASTTW